MKVYLETLSKEKAELEKELSTASANIILAKKIESELEGRIGEQEERIKDQEGLLFEEEKKREKDAAMYEEKLKAMEEAIEKAQEAADATIAEIKKELKKKDEELALVRDEQVQRLNTSTKKSEEIQGYLKAAEAEKAEHKAKRLAARNEMINLAQALEEVTEAARTVDTSLQFTLLPRAIEQIALLEYTIGQVDEATRALTRASRGGSEGGVGSSMELRPLGRRRSSSGRWIPLGTSGVSPQQADDRKTSMSGTPLLATMNSDEGGEDEKIPAEETENASSRRNSWSKPGKLLPRDRVDQLDNEMDRVSAGLNLLGQSVERLNEAVALANQNLCTKLMGEIMKVFREQSERRNGYTGVSLVEPTSIAPPSSSSGTNNGSLEIA